MLMARQSISVLAKDYVTEYIYTHTHWKRYKKVECMRAERSTRIFFYLFQLLKVCYCRPLQVSFMPGVSKEATVWKTNTSRGGSIEHLSVQAQNDKHLSSQFWHFKSSCFYIWVTKNCASSNSISSNIAIWAVWYIYVSNKVEDQHALSCNY